MATLRLRRIRPAASEWDALVRAYPMRTLFHESAWHRHLLDIHPEGRMEYFEIRQGDRPVGVHCGLRIRKFGVPIHGSPLGGTGTNFMGPLAEPEFGTPALLSALAGVLGPFGAWHLELSHWQLDEGVLRTAGYDVYPGVTHLIRLPDSEDAAWNGLKSACRNRVRKAQQNGLTVRVASDAAVADRFYEQFIEVYAKQGMVTPFGVERGQSLFRHLQPAGRLLPLEVVHEGRVLASGLFPYDDTCIYFWGAGSWLKEQHLCPNELLHWEVIRFAVANGLRAYNMCGGRSQFKDKFGGEDVPYVTYSRSAIPGLRTARAFYRKWHFARLKRAQAIDAAAVRAKAKEAEPAPAATE